jgi:hypothetical protein
MPALTSQISYIKSSLTIVDPPSAHITTLIDDQLGPFGHRARSLTHPTSFLKLPNQYNHSIHAMSALEEYTRKRAELIASERALRFDAGAIADATENEKRALEIVREIKVREAREVWGAGAEKLVYPGMEFLIARETICECLQCCDRAT